MRELLTCLRFLFALSWATDRGRLCRGGGLLLLGNLATPLVSLGLKYLIDETVGGHRAAAVGWAVAVAVFLVGELMLGHFAHLFYFELGEIDELTLNRRLLRLVSSSRGLEQADDQAFADVVELLREDIASMRQNIQHALELVCLAAQTVVTGIILAFVQPWLLLLPLAAVVPVLLGASAQRVIERARERAAVLHRRLRHLRTLACDPASQKEIRVCAAADYLVERQVELHRAVGRILIRAQFTAAAVRTVGQLCFGLAYVASVAVVFVLAAHGTASVGDVVLVVALATQTSSQVANGLNLLRHLYSAAAGTRRFAELRSATVEVSRPAATTVEPDPSVAATAGGILFDRVTFRYPGAAAPVLRELTLRLPAGCTVALVGENGAGKSTLIRLLTGLYRPTSGRVLVDTPDGPADTATLDPVAWRERAAVLFQDFARLEFTLRESVGVGRLADIHSDAAVSAAIDRARAGALLERLDGGLDALLGHRFGDGVELSGGQWQSVGLARTLMRPDPLLLCLDEPGSALDPFAEQQVCEAYREIADEIAARVGGVTIFVTHRLSTVTLADLIVVLEHGRVVESGSHTELMAAGGRYAKLFALQSRAYA